MREGQSQKQNHKHVTRKEATHREQETQSTRMRVEYSGYFTDSDLNMVYQETISKSWL